MNTIQVRQGTLEEALNIARQIKEFSQTTTRESLKQRLEGKSSLILVAEENQQLLGFKMGYRLDESTFYSWLGGVVVNARGKGIAQALLDEQEKWARDHNYQNITVKSRNQFPSMLRLLLRNDYLIDNYEKRDDPLASRIHFIKRL